jgi:(1->4)-alpha-D-glucan 1-alpha-D-glucosylmutase
MATIPRSTYRLQLHAQFGFDAAREVLPYLARLGISHVYCSPIWRARPGSTHGYDVVDHSRISAELGGETRFRAFAAHARALGLGLLLDIVPNHMGVFGAENPWWLDVLENGQASEFAQYFDIDWHPPNKALDAKLLVPVLGDHYGNALDAGELRLSFDGESGGFALEYAEHRFPLDPRSYPAVLRRAAGHVPEGLVAGFEDLPSRDDVDEGSRAIRRTQQRALRAELARLSADAAIRSAIDAAVASVNDEKSRDALSDLHDAQAFRLSYWRVASGEINYRRFFDINSLAALRVEDERVFEATQGLALDLAAEGAVDGLRVDHSDGLHDPAQYFARLQSGYRRRVAAAKAMEPPEPLYVLAEKIVGEGEQLPAEWAIHGTTGYDFMALVNGLFVERRNAVRLDRIWRNFSENRHAYADTVRDCKQRVARRSLAAEARVLANALQRIALTDRRTRDYSLDDLREALSDVAACLPVYRTYVSQAVSPQDTRFVDSAIEEARRHSEVNDPTIFDFIRAALLTPARPAAGSDAVPDSELKNRFAMRFQQFSSPVAAKGVEDTAFYRYHRLVSLSEVGGTPAVFGISAHDFHAANARRLAQWPHTMLATSTHDNKRSEDVRHRIDVLSEQPAALRLGLRHWRAAVDRWRPLVDGARAPSNEDLCLLYQTLLGSLPAEGFADAQCVASYRERIQQYMRKAVREAKCDSSWDHPNEAYEHALRDLVDRVLSDGKPNALLDELLARSAGIAWLGALNSLSATVLKLTSPGVPDVYQGTELIDLSLVDPDNRRPVDYAARRALLDGFRDDTDATALARTAPDGRIKLWCMARLLALRHREPELFASGAYVRLRVHGAARNSAIAYARRGRDATLIVVASRKLAGMNLKPGELPGREAWGDTHIQCPKWLQPGAETTDALTGASSRVGADAFALADVLTALPVAAVMVRER